jgi:hypothetical protein
MVTTNAVHVDYAGSYKCPGHSGRTSIRGHCEKAPAKVLLGKTYTVRSEALIGRKCLRYCTCVLIYLTEESRKRFNALRNAWLLQKCQ